MATNLRLRPELESVLRDESVRTGRSQQDLIREALERFLASGAASSISAHHSLDDLIAAGVVKPPREPFRRASRLLELPELPEMPEGTTTMDLLDREDRF